MNNVQGGFANQLQILQIEINTLSTQPVSSDGMKFLSSIMPASKCEDITTSTNLDDKVLFFTDINEISTKAAPTKSCSEGVITDFTQFKNIDKPTSIQIPEGTKLILFDKTDNAKSINSRLDPESVQLNTLKSIYITK
jgi:hypothetical protein